MWESGTSVPIAPISLLPSGSETLILRVLCSTTASRIQTVDTVDQILRWREVAVA